MSRSGMRRPSVWAGAIGAALVVLLPLLAWTPAASAVTTTSITVDATKTGRTFDGIGAISGGGGNSRLLYDYPETQRNQILDYLFKPGYGANLQILKVEIGGDTNSTDGAEPSHMHSRTDLNCNRGYEWWLMAQAKLRNPNIKLAALSWGLPGWAGGANHTFWTDDTIDYLIKWLDCAKSDNLAIDYMGGWNEKGFDAAWYEKYHARLAATYPKVKVVGDDGVHGWLVADSMVSDAAFAKSVDIVGAHYICGHGTTAGSTCRNSTNARSLNKPLWASEMGSLDYQDGAIGSARTFNRGYIDSRVTGYLNWPAVAAISPNLMYATTGLLVAGEPWSGKYTVGKNLWAMAHTTQFTKPGWTYQDSASGYLAGDRAKGSYVTLRSTNHVDYSTIVETADATAAQSLSVSIRGGLSTGTVHVWATKLTSTNPADWFVKKTDITPSSGHFSITLQPGMLYSLTTTTGQGKGTAASSAGATMPLPYADDYESYGAGQEAKYLADMDGSFETVACGGGRSGMCVRQMASEAPVLWRTDSTRDPSALLGDVRWTDYTVASDVMLEHSGYVELQGRVGTQGHAPNDVNAYFLRISDTGAWSILKSDTTAALTTLKSGQAAALGTGTWHRLALGFSGSTISASLDGKALGSATDSTYPSGQVGIGTSQTINVQYDNVSVTPPASSGGTLLSQGRPVVASSEGGSGYVATNAVDGSTATRWASVSHIDPQWIRVDLGATKSISDVRLTWDVSCATTYRIETSTDDSTWTQVYSTTTGDGAVDDLPLTASGRYVRMFGSVRCRDAGYSLREFQVFGS
jgi:hypothetical protein